MHSEIFETLSPTKLLIRCAVPAMITMVFGALYQIADGLFVGRFIGGDALAAVNLIMPILMISFALSDTIAAGASVRISILLGQKQCEEASQVFSFTLKIIFLLSCLLGIIGFFFAEAFLHMLAPGASEDAIQYGITYIRVYAVFAPALFISFATDNFLRVCGKERWSMWLGIGSQCLNILLDVILIVFLHQGVWAAAFTSCLAMALTSLLSLWSFRGKRLDLFYTKKNISLTSFLRIIVNGSSAFFGNMATSILSIIYNFFLLAYGGTTAVAAFSVIMYVDSIIGMMVFGLSSSLQPAISYCYGAGQIEKVKAIFRRILLSAIALSLLSMLFMLFAGPYVAPLFIKPEETELLALSIVGMKLFAFSYLSGWVDVCFSSFFTALERPMRSLITSLFGTLLFPVFFLYLLTPSWHLNGVWLTPLMAGTASAGLTLLLAWRMKLPKESLESESE